MFKRIMVALGARQDGERAFMRALQLSDGAPYRLAIVASFPSEAFALDYGAQHALQAAEAMCQSQLEQLKLRAQSFGVQATTIVAHGALAREVVRAADDWHADVIVAADHGVATRWLLPSATGDIVAHAHCPVLVVR